MDSFKTHDLHIPATTLAAVLKPSTIVGFVCVFLISQLLLFAARCSKTSMAGIPGPSGWPLVGIGLDLPTRPRELLNKWAAKYGDTFKVRVGWYNWVFFNNRDAVKEIFDRQVEYSYLAPPLFLARRPNRACFIRPPSRPASHIFPSLRSTASAAMVSCR